MAEKGAIVSTGPGMSKKMVIYSKELALHVQPYTLKLSRRSETSSPFRQTFISNLDPILLATFDNSTNLLTTITQKIS